MTEGTVWSWEWVTVGNQGSLEFSIVERSCVVVVWKEEEYSGICGVLREAVSGDTSRHRGVYYCGSETCCVLVVCSKQ